MSLDSVPSLGSLPDKQVNRTSKKVDKSTVPKDLNVTFARLDGAAIQIKNLLYMWLPDHVVYGDIYMLGVKLKQLPPMPKPDLHIEFAWANVNNSIIIVRGTTEKHAATKKMLLVGEVFQFNLDTLV
ncbi:hypothetical protein COCNU_02G013040 [Cocos nucifera]|uniref:Uncharacterized protein n=1 Tax=Cocos nucifera TaxID=13894 RepID=A0A8K0HZS9_COCNU|nr:hypothetical protein COCNU_02G013040 [Cocos nucifera]